MVTVSPSASASAMVEVRAPSAAATSAFEGDERAATRAHNTDGVMGTLRARVRSRCSAMWWKLSSVLAERSRHERREPDWTGVLLKTRFSVRNAPVESRLADAQPAGFRESGPGWFAVSGRDASKSPGGPVAPAGRSTGGRRKRSGNRRCISRAHWPAALSSEQSCGSPYTGSRARGMRCPQSVCAGIRTYGELRGFPPTPPCDKRAGAPRRWGEMEPRTRCSWDLCSGPAMPDSVTLTKRRG